MQGSVCANMVEPRCSVTMSSPSHSTHFQKCSIRIFPILHSVLAATIMTFVAGLVNGFASPALVELTQLENEELRFDTTLSDVFGCTETVGLRCVLFIMLFPYFQLHLILLQSSSLVGAIFGAFIGGYVADRWGRKTALACNVIPYMVGFFTVVITSVIQQPLAFKILLVTSRFITGVGQSWSYVAVSIYIGEIMVAKTRGLFVSLADLISFSGILTMLGFGSIPGAHYYQLALIPLAILLVFVLMIIWIPETPRWLLLKFKDRPRAVAVLKYLKGPSINVEKKLNQIQKSSVNVKRLPLYEILRSLFCQRDNLIPFLVASLVVIHQQTCGILAFLNNIGTIFIKSKAPNPEFTGFLVGLALIPGTVLCLLLVDILGRKTLLIIGVIGMGVGQVLIGFQFFFTRPKICNIDNATEVMLDASSTEDCSLNLYPLAIASGILYILSFSISVGPNCSIIASEYLPLQVKGIANGILWSLNRLVGALIAGTFLNFSKWAGDWTAWWTLSFVNFMAFVAIALFVVETKGKELEDIPEIFRKRYTCLRRT